MLSDQTPQGPVLDGVLYFEGKRSLLSTALYGRSKGYSPQMGTDIH